MVKAEIQKKKEFDKLVEKLQDGTTRLLFDEIPFKYQRRLRGYTDLKEDAELRLNKAKEIIKDIKSANLRLITDEDPVEYQRRVRS